MPFGTDPYFNPNDVELIDQERYKIMDENMQKSGTMGKWMMRCTSSIQVNIDASTERDMEEMVFIADCINPIASYLFSNSPSKNNKLSLEKILEVSYGAIPIIPGAIIYLITILFLKINC